MAQQGRRNQRKDPQQHGRYIKTMQDLIDEKRIEFDQSNETHDRLKKIGEMARETVEKKRQLEVILKKLDEEEEKYPSAKTLFSGKEFTPAEKNDRGVLDDYGLVFNKFSEVIDQCGKVALIHRKGHIEYVTKAEDIDFINGKGTFVEETIKRKKAKRDDLQEQLYQETERNKEQGRNKNGRFSGTAATETPATTTTTTTESEGTTSSSVVYIQSEEERLRAELDELDAEIANFENYAKEAKMLLTLRNLNVSEEDISDEEKQNIIEFTIEQLVNRGANREELYLEEKVDGEKTFGFLNTGKAQKLINDKIGELTKAENILEGKNKSDKEGIKTRNDKAFANIRKNVYETIGEGRFRVLITVLPNIIGKEGLFSTKMAVYDTLSGKDAADDLSSVRNMKDDISNAEVIGKAMRKAGKDGRDGEKGKRSIETLRELVSQCEDEKEKLRLQKELEEAKKIDDQEKAMKNSRYHKLDAEDLKQLEDASFKALEDMGEVLEKDSDYFTEEASRKDNLTELNSLMVPRRGENVRNLGVDRRFVGTVNLKDNRSKLTRFSKAMRGVSRLSKAATNGSRALASGFGTVAANNEGNGLEIMAKPIPPVPVPPFTGSKPRRGEGESQASYDLREQQYQKDLNDYIAKKSKYDEAMEKYNEDKEKYDKYVKDGVHWNQNKDVYDSQHPIFNTFSKAESAATAAAFGFKAIGDVAKFAASASELSYQKKQMGNLRSQAIGILSPLKLRGEAQGRKENILRALEGSKPHVAASHATKKKLDIPTALDEMQVNMEYELSPRQKQQLALAAAATRACSGIKYKEDLSKLNLVGGAVSATANAISAVGNVFTLLNNPALSVAFQIAGATLGIVSTMVDVYVKKAMERKKEIKNKQLGKFIASAMNALFNIKDPDGNLPSLADLDSLFLKDEDEDGTHHYDGKTATISKIDQAENAVAAYDLLTGAGVDMDDMMVTAMKGSEAKNKTDDVPVTEENALDLLDLNKDYRDESFYRMRFLAIVASA